MSKKEELEIFDIEDKGYKTAVSYGTWRVGCINWSEKIDGFPKKRERHNLTDEVFIPVTGKSTLYIGEELSKTDMEPGKIYNVKKGVWHSVILEKGAKVYVVENIDTGEENSEIVYFE